MAKNKNKDFLKEELIKEDLRMKNLYTDNINTILKESWNLKSDNLNDLKLKKKEFLENMYKYKNQYELTINWWKTEQLKLKTEYKNIAIYCKELEVNLDELKKQNEKEFNDLNYSNSEKEKNILKDIESLEAKYEGYKNDFKLMMDLKSQLSSIKDELKVEKIQKLTDIANKEKEKVIETIKLKKKIEQKEREAEKSLTKLKNDEINITTKLTFLQNYQLNGELDYQSKEIEELLEKNKYYQEIVNNLKKEVEIHKQVENELSNKSQKSQDLIKEMSNDLKNKEEINLNLDKKIKTFYDKLDNLNLEKLENNYKYHENFLNTKNKEHEVLKNKNNFIIKKLNIQTKKLENLYDNDSLIINNIINVINKIELYFKEDNQDDNTDFSLFKKNEKLLKNLFDANFSNIEDLEIWQCEKIFKILLSEFKSNLIFNKKEITDIKNNSNFEVSFNKKNKSNNYFKLPKIKSKIEPKNLIDKKNSNFKNLPVNLKAQVIQLSLNDINKLGIRLKK